MSQQAGDMSAMSEEAVLALSAAAARRERRNQPTYLVLLGAMVLVGSCVWAFVQWNGAREAADLEDKAKITSASALKAIAKIKAFDEAAAANGATASETPKNVRSTIELAGPRAGLKRSVGVGTSNTSRTSDSKWNQVRYSYTIREEKLDTMLAWVETVRQELPDVEVSAISLAPETNEWRMTVTFVRFERAAEGST